MIKKNSSIYELLAPLAIEVVLFLLAKAEKEGVRKTLSNYITKLRYTTPALRGADLKRLGIEPGPAMGDILRVLLRRRLDNELSTKEEEEEAVRGLVPKKSRQTMSRCWKRPVLTAGWRKSISTATRTR